MPKNRLAVKTKKKTNKPNKTFLKERLAVKQKDDSDLQGEIRFRPARGLAVTQKIIRHARKIFDSDLRGRYKTKNNKNINETQRRFLGRYPP